MVRSHDTPDGQPDGADDDDGRGSRRESARAMRLPIRMPSWVVGRAEAEADRAASANARKASSDGLMVD